MIDGRCRFGYPQAFRSTSIIRERDGHPLLKRIAPQDGGGSAEIQRYGKTFVATEAWISEYNPTLLTLLKSHINVAPCGELANAAYLFAYLTKTGGSDKTTMHLEKKGAPVDEIKQFIDCRVLTPSAASFVIHGWSKFDMKPPVLTLTTHLPDEQFLAFDPSNPPLTQELVKKHEVTMMTAWFVLCRTEAKERLEAATASGEDQKMNSDDDADLPELQLTNQAPPLAICSSTNYLITTRGRRRNAVGSAARGHCPASIRSTHRRCFTFSNT